MTAYSSITRTSKFILLFSCSILPLFFLPVTRDPFDTNKWILFVFLALCVLLLWTLRLVLKGDATISWSGVTLGFGLVTAASFLSLTFSSFNKIEALLSPLGPVTWTAGTIILFFGPTLFSEREKILLRIGMAITGGIAGLLLLYQQIGLGALLSPSNSTAGYPFFTPIGSPMGFLVFCILVAPISISIALHALKENKEVIAAVSVVTSVLTVLGIGIAIVKFGSLSYWKMLHLPTGLMFVRASWDSIVHFLFGVGPERFFEIFSLHRPASLNMTPAWDIGFSVNASLLLHIGSTLGIVGVLSFIVLCVGLWTGWSGHPVTRIQAALCILLAFFVPPTLIFIIVCTIFLLSSETPQPVKSELQGLGRLVGIPLFLIIVISLYGLFRWYSGELLVYEALRASNTGNGTKTFILQERALKTNPMNPGFHMALSQTAILLAEGIIKNAPQTSSTMPDLSNEDKTLLTNLTSRGIQEAKLAITLSPSSVYTWVNLARAYQVLIGIAKDSDTWAIAAYQKAMTLDPTNPVLHLDLGGLYMSIEKYEDAGKEFIAALYLKPNYIDAFYNLAHAFRQKGDWDNAVKSLEQTKLLFKRGSPDEQKIEEEIIAILEEKKVQGSSNQPTTLFVPQLNIPN